LSGHLAGVDAGVRKSFGGSSKSRVEKRGVNSMPGQLGIKERRSGVLFRSRAAEKRGGKTRHWTEIGGWM